MKNSFKNAKKPRVEKRTTEGEETPEEIIPKEEVCVFFKVFRVGRALLYNFLGR